MQQYTEKETFKRYLVFTFLPLGAFIYRYLDNAPRCLFLFLHLCLTLYAQVSSPQIFSLWNTVFQSYLKIP